MMFCAQPGWISRNSPSSTTRRRTSCMSYGSRGSSGTMVSSSTSIRSTGSVDGDDRRDRAGCSAAGGPATREPRRGRWPRRAPRCARRRCVSCASSAPPRILAVDLLVGHGLHDVRPGDEHVARPFDHHGEVGDRRRVDRAAGARSEDHRDLRARRPTPGRCAGRCRRSRPATRRLPGCVRRRNR